MREAVRAAIASVVVLSLLVAAGLAMYASRPLPGAGVKHLRIAYAMMLPGSSTVPHKSMVEEVVSAFRSWYKEHYGANVVVDVDYHDAAAFAKQLGLGRLKYDVWWGGRVQDFEAHRDLLLPFNSTAKEELNRTCWSCPLMDLEGPTPTWYAWCLYAVCLLYDPELLPNAPKSWPELADPRLENQVIAPDPGVDPFTWGVALSIYASEAWRLGNESSGWRSAWNISLTFWGLSDSLASKPFPSALEVAAGRKAAILCSDIVAYHMLLEAGYSHLRLAYLNGTLLFPCPVAVLKGAAHKQVARAFVDFLLSREGQAIVAKHLMPVRPDVAVEEPVRSPFRPDFPAVRAVNRTFLDMAAEFIHDYHLSWVVKLYDGSGKEGRLRTAWLWVRRAAQVAEANENATRLYQLALGNLTLMCSYVAREDVDHIYNQTGGWVEKGDYIDEWLRKAEEAYRNAVENARKAVELSTAAAANARDAP